MSEIDLTPTVPEVIDGHWKRETLRRELKKMGYDHRDVPEVDRGIEFVCESRIQTSPNKKSFSVVDKSGTPRSGSIYAMRALAQEIAANIESEREPTANEILEMKRRDPGYGPL